MKNRAQPSEATEHYITMLRRHFPQLQQSDIYLDNAATTLKPDCVIDAICRFYSQEVANVHRASHRPGRQATHAFEATRTQLKHYLNAPSTGEIIWTSGTTESINLVAQGFLRNLLKPGDEVIISAIEHHANIIPWQQLTQACNATLKLLPFTKECRLDPNELQQLCTDKTRLIAITGLSNVLGYAPDLNAIIKTAKQFGAYTLVDGAQRLMHGPADLKQIDCDFFVGSGHKMLGPTGVGFLYGKKALLEQFTPVKFGGEMIKDVSYHHCDYAELPFRLEAGTPNIAGVIGLGKALEFLDGLNWEFIRQHEALLMQQLAEELQNIAEIKLIGSPPYQGLISFYVDGIHHQDLAMLLDEQHIALRSGNLCAMPFIKALGLPGVIRVSPAFYNNKADIDQFIIALKKSIELLKE